MSIETPIVQTIEKASPHLKDALQQVFEPLVPVVVPAINKIASLSNRALMTIADLSQRFSHIEAWKYGVGAGGVASIINFVFYDSPAVIYSLGLSTALAITASAFDSTGGMTTLAIGAAIGSALGKMVGEALHSYGRSKKKIVRLKSKDVIAKHKHY